MFIIYDIHEIDNILTLYRQDLVLYCQYLANKYNETIEGEYRIKYNVLYPLLFNNLSNNKRVEFFNSFISRMKYDYDILLSENEDLFLSSLYDR